MPLYEYFCKKCNYTYEKYVQLSQKNEQRCDICNKILTKQISSGIIDLKGKGFYKPGVS